MLERAHSHQRFNWNCTKWNKFQEQRLCYTNLQLIYNLAIKALTLNVEGKFQFNIWNYKFFLSKALKSFDFNCYFWWIKFFLLLFYDVFSIKKWLLFQSFFKDIKCCPCIYCTKIISIFFYSVEEVKASQQQPRYLENKHRSATK